MRQPLFLGALGLLLLPPDAHAQGFDSNSALCVAGECGPAITQTTFLGRSAYRLSDGKSEAVVVPSLGRVMRWGKVGGPNLLWNSASVSKNPNGWKNYGGDKTWLAPQSSWKTLHGANNWPPDVAFDGAPHEAEVLSGGLLKLTSNTSKSGVRLERVMSFNARGEFEIKQTATKVAGAPVRVSLWSISQSDAPDAVFIPASPASPYRDGFYKFSPVDKPSPHPANARGALFEVRPQASGGGAKFGVDAPTSSIVAVKGGIAWLQRAAKPEGQYPDGAEGAGFPVEVYINGDPKTNYTELELLGPLVNLYQGMTTTHTVRWSLHDLPSQNANDDATRTAVEALLTP